jgi:hypothetical protein
MPKGYFFHYPLEKLRHRSFVPLCSDHHLQNLAFMIDGAPEVAEPAWRLPTATKLLDYGSRTSPASVPLFRQQ